MDLLSPFYLLLALALSTQGADFGNKTYPLNHYVTMTLAKSGLKYHMAEGRNYWYEGRVQKRRKGR